VKHPLTLAVTLWWLGMVALLVHRQTPPPAVDLATLPPLDAGSTTRREEWFGLYQGEHKIGHTRRRTRRTPSGHRFEEQSTFSLTMLGTRQRLTTALLADTDASFALRRFRFSLDSPATRFAATGVSDGRTLRVRYGSGGRGGDLVIPLDEPIHLASALRPRIAAARPAPGTRYTHAVFDPLTLGRESVTTVVEAHERLDGRDALRVAEEHRGLRARAWLDEDGGVLREEAPLGFVLRREPAAVARTGADGAPALDLAIATRIPVARPIASPRDLGRLTLRVSGAAADRIPDDPPRQRITGDVLRIVREEAPAAGALPAAGPGGPPGHYLAPSPFVESDDPHVVATARAVAGGDGDPAVRAARLTRWVHRQLTREPTASIPSAREVLRTRRGDCNEHAVLLTALARAAEIPARVVAGAVYLEDGFYYHAWSELWLGRWVSADPVFDQMPADATHVKLLEGGPERHLALAETIGRLSFAAMEEDS
jgi:hypothetical protein